jgi:hypothetical protein
MPTGQTREASTLNCHAEQGFTPPTDTDAAKEIEYGEDEIARTFADNLCKENDITDPVLKTLVWEVATAQISVKSLNRQVQNIQEALRQSQMRIVSACVGFSQVSDLASKIADLPSVRNLPEVQNLRAQLAIAMIRR